MNHSFQPACLSVTDLPWQDPASVFAIFCDDPCICWLDSQGEGRRARYSYLCVSPFEVHDCGDAFVVLDQFAQRFACAADEAPVPFAGGAAGFLGYECAASLERVPLHARAGLPDFFIGFYDVVFAWDHARHGFWLMSNGLPEALPHARHLRARARRDEMLRRLADGRTRDAGQPWLTWRQETSRLCHEARVARAVDYIRAGDIFQANITARFAAARPPGVMGADIHLALRAANPAPYGAFLAGRDGFAIASVSPERFIGVAQDGSIEARPIKGTSARAADPAEDAALAACLLASAKDRAENLMIVDLLRNDIGRVARFGSMHVPELARLESFAHVHHLVSSICGKLRAGARAADLMRAAFPGGSITGAPKIRAIEIIHELEQVARGPYCGSMFWLGGDGAMDSSILIRTATITADAVTIQAGGGIVADSDPAAEYAEMFLKARPLLAALGALPA